MADQILPKNHTPVVPVERIRIQFSLWWSIFLHLARYVYGQDARHLPDRDQIDSMIAILGGEDYMQSFIEEEICAIEVMFERYRTSDPKACMTSAEVIAERVLPVLIQGDRYWVSDPARKRPGTILGHPHDSMIRRLALEAHRKRGQDRRLTDCESLYLRVSSTLDDIQKADPEYSTLPAYRKLIAEYNAKHPDAQVDCLHLP